MIFAPKRQDVALRKHDVFMNVNALPYELNCIFNPLSGLSFLMHGFITLSDATSYGPGHAKTRLMSYASNKGADQPEHPHSLISTFVVHCLDSMICILAIYNV